MRVEFVFSDRADIRYTVNSPLQLFDKMVKLRHRLNLVAVYLPSGRDSYIILAHRNDYWKPIFTFNQDELADMEALEGLAVKLWEEYIVARKKYRLS